MKRIIVITALWLSMSINAAQLTAADQQTKAQQEQNLDQLLEAIRSKKTSLKEVRQLLAQPLPILKKTCRSKDPFVEAIRRGNFDVIPLFCSHYKDAGEREKSWYLALIVQAIKLHGGCKMPSIYTMIGDSIECRPNCAIRLGIERHGSVEKFRQAAFQGMEYLLENGADVDHPAEFSDPERLLTFAARTRDLKLCDLLLRHEGMKKLKENYPDQVTLVEAYAKQDKALQELLDDHRVESQPNRKQDLSAALHTQTTLPTAVINLIISQI